jgi:hypothetical protein
MRHAQCVRLEINTDKRKYPVIQELNQQQVEQAFRWLQSPLPSAPPQGLESLNQLEWFLLRRMLDSLLLEKGQSLVQ